MPATRAPSLPPLVRAALLGAATGSRSTLGLQAVARSTGNRTARRAAAVAVLGELVADKLPQTPSRLEPTGLGARVVSAALGGAAVGRRAVAAPVAVVGALCSAFGLHAARVAVGRATGRPDALVAVGEDALALALGVLARPPRGLLPA